MCNVSIPSYYYVRSSHFRKNKEKSFEMEHNVTVLDTLTQNLHPDIAQQVTQSWVDPIALQVKQLIGNGKCTVTYGNHVTKSVTSNMTVIVVLHLHVICLTEKCSMVYMAVFISYVFAMTLPTS